jgi:hypothetical protein
MIFTFFHRPEARKFNYKPQFHVPEEEKPTNPEKFDSDDFSKKLRSSWDRTRRNRSNSTANMRIIIWMAFLLLVLGLLCWKIFNF